VAIAARHQAQGGNLSAIADEFGGPQIQSGFRRNQRVQVDNGEVLPQESIGGDAGVTRERVADNLLLGVDEVCFAVLESCRWFPDGIRFLVNQNPPEERERGYSATIWSVPVVGGTPRKLRENGGVESISPDGSLVAFTTDTQNVWLMGPNGERARKIYSSPSNKEIRNFRFSANGKRLMYVEFPGGDLMSCDLNGGNSVKMLPSEGVRLRDYLWLPDGRIVYSLTEPSPNINACNIWQLRVANDTGRPEGKPQRLTNWAGSCVENLSATVDGKVVAFQQWTVHASAFVADVEGGGTRIATPTRLTVDERWSVPSAWSLDSKSVVVESKFNGQTGIYQERLDTHDSQPLVTELPDISDQTPFSPDGSWILYSVKPASGSGGGIVRAPVNGGTPEVVTTEANSGVRCTRSPSALCVIADRSVAPTFSLSTFDPLKGRGSELAKIDVDPESECFWDLSPDGQHIAVLEGLSGHIHILSLSDKSIRVIKPIGMETSSFINWTADGRAILVSRPSRRGFELLLLGLNGNMHVLWEQIGGLGTSALASPDGKHLAIRGWSVSSNFWSMTNF
jgi:eukaryotic-like serine/threonine-protein kinase